MYICKNLNLIDNKRFKVEIGKIANKTSSSVKIDIDDTRLIISVVWSESNENTFLPLKIEYFERFYANSKIPYNYFKREGKASEREILIGRLIDRSIRPMFSRNFFYDIQITIVVISINQNISPDVIAINGISIALTLSGLPFEIIGSIKIIFRKNEVINSNKLDQSNFQLILSGKKNFISMIEGFFDDITCEDLISIFKYSIKEINLIIEFIHKLKNGLKKKIVNYKKKFNSEIYKLIKKIYYKNLKKDYFNNNYYNNKNNQFIINNYIEQNIFSIKNQSLDFFLKLIKKNILRKKIIKKKIRLDQRNFLNLRKINIEIMSINKINNLIIFTKGETQALINITLGSYKDIQVADSIFLQNKKNNFILHYNFPPYAVNEIGNFGIIKRREIGHGNLAKMALISVIPLYDDYPYVIRIVSEITSSSGSSSMATVCGSSLALISIGVPIKNQVAGISLGLISEKNDIVILSDISGEEDLIGDMDFKISGTKNGITAIQMDMKRKGININTFYKILKQGLSNLKSILFLMESKIKNFNKLNENFISKIKILKIKRTKIKDVVGKNGIIIKNLMDKYHCDIHVNEEGLIKIFYDRTSNINKFLNEVKNLTQNIKTNIKKNSICSRFCSFGFFSNLINKNFGLIYISRKNVFKSNKFSIKIKDKFILDIIIFQINKNNKIKFNLV